MLVETKRILLNQGFLTLKDYLKDLSEIYNVPYDLVYSLYEILGDTELFDGLVSAVQDAEEDFSDSF